MLTLRKALTSIATLALFVGATACSDASFTAPSSPDVRASSIILESTSTALKVTSGDTTVTVFTVNVNGSTGTMQLGNDAKIVFPFGAGSICDMTRSSYGAGTWDSACPASKKSVTITAKTWLNAQGFTEVDFQPAMRFVPRLSKSVTLSLKNAAPTGRIDFRDAFGRLVNEAATDASLVSTIDTTSNWVTRIIKHFSGYTVTAD